MRTITYKLPNERYGTDDSMGKTSTCEYNGPDKLVCWVINNEEVTRVVDSFAEDEVPDRPTPLNYTVVEIDATESDENAVLVSLLYGGNGEIRMIEINNGVDEIPNKVIADPTDIREIFDKPKAMNGYDLNTETWAALEYCTGDTVDRTDESVRGIRDGLLFPTDSKIADDMPAELKQEWLDFRSVLRELPTLTANIPNNLIGYPTAPDQPNPLDLLQEFVTLDNRTETDQWAIDNQLPNNIT